MKEILKYFLGISVLVLFQILVFNQITLLGYGCVFAYLLLIIVAPLNVKTIPFMLIAFVIGLTIDIFSQSYGVHTFAATLVAATRRWVLNLFFSKDELEYNTSLFVKFSYDYYKYIVLIVFIYCFTVFSLEAFSFELILPILQKTGVSTLITSVFIFFIQSVTLKKYNER